MAAGAYGEGLMSDIVAVSNAAADAAGIPRLLLLACGSAESGLRADARRPADPSQDQRYWPDVSGGCWQQTVRWDPEYRAGSAYPGEVEIERVLNLQYDPERSARIAAANLAGKWAAYQPDVLATLSAYNWPAGHGVPVSQAVEQNYRRGIAEAQRLLGAAPVPTPDPLPTPVPAPAPPPTRVTFTPQEPAHLQEHSYDCSQDSAEWAMWSLGRKPTDGWMEATMIADGIMSPELGLLDGSGQRLAEWIVQQYGEFGFLANNEPDVSFDWAAMEGAHVYPILLGGHRWSPDRQSGHWVGCWGYDLSRDVLLLANPAPNWAGVGQEMTRQQFDDLGPFSAVRIWHPDLLTSIEPPPPPPPPPPTPPPPNLAAWKAEGLSILDGEDQAFRDTIRAWISRMPV